MILLTIAIPTIIGREAQLEKLITELERQKNLLNDPEQVEIITMKDNKELTIGQKREILYNLANGKFTVQWDDDDWILDKGLELIIKSIITNPNVDVIGYKELCVFDGSIFRTSCLSSKYETWGNNQDGFNYVRTPHHKSPIRTEICKEAGVAYLRFGEDFDFSKRVKPLIKSEKFIDQFIYIYQYSSKETYNNKYGIK